MAHRRMTRTPNGWQITDTASGQTVALVPSSETGEPADLLAREIKHLPPLIELAEKWAAAGDTEARQILEQIGRPRPRNNRLRTQAKIRTTENSHNPRENRPARA